MCHAPTYNNYPIRSNKQESLWDKNAWKAQSAIKSYYIAVDTDLFRL